MKTKIVLSVAGLAVCGAADAQVRPDVQSLPFSGQVIDAISATAVTGLTVDGQYVYGDTIHFNQGANARGSAVIAYDSYQAFDTDGDTFIDPVCADFAPHNLSAPSSRYFFGTEFSWQSYSEDIVPASGTEGMNIDTVHFGGTFPLCDNGSGTVSEPLQVVVESWEVIDNFPDLDGTDGYDDDGDTLVFPFRTSDTDGDTFVDEFNGAIIFTYANTDTDGDTQPDELLSLGALGWGAFRGGPGAASLGIPLPSGQDVHDGSGGGPDGRPDGGIRLLWTRGDGGDMGGPLLGGRYPSTRAQSMLWGTTAMEVAGGNCPYDGTAPAGFGVGDSDGTIWGEGEDLCNDPNNAGGAWSEGAPSGNEAVDEMHDPNFDIADWFGIVPDFQALGLMIRIDVGDGGQPVYDCCDVNDDGACTPADFSAWINAFNNQDPRCDANDDGTCTPADFSGWINAYNASTGGNALDCVE